MRNIVRGSRVLLVVAAMLSNSVAQAMEIHKFDNLAFTDQGDYIELLVDGAQKGLIGEGKRDLAAKVAQLFTETLPGDKMPLGLVEFETNLALARVADAKRVEKDHNAPRLEVEHAMIVTLKKNGILLPKSFMHVGDNFKPKHPPKQSATTTDAPPTSTKKPPMVMQNPDGTLIIQKGPPQGEAKNAKAKKGLVIPPQVVIPIVPAPLGGKGRSAATPVLPSHGAGQDSPQGAAQLLD